MCFCRKTTGQPADNPRTTQHTKGRSRSSSSSSSRSSSSRGTFSPGQPQHQDRNASRSPTQLRLASPARTHERNETISRLGSQGLTPPNLQCMYYIYIYIYMGAPLSPHPCFFALCQFRCFFCICCFAHFNCKLIRKRSKAYVLNVSIVI